MNLRHYHRSNTEEYKRELQGLNGLTQLPLFPRSQMTYPPEVKGRATHYPITHAQPLMKSEPLLKANFKQLKQMFPNTNEHDHVLKWASDIKNNDLQSFYLRHYRNNPSIHTDVMKEKIGHINGMIDISDEMKKVKLSKEDTLESGLQKYEDAEKKWQTGNGSRFVTPSATTKPVIDFGDGWGWFDLGVPVDKDEGNALGHCGNAGNPHENDRILSLRKVHNIGGKIYHEPALTFINNQGWIGEMKGRNNSKPSEKYHSRIAELLKHKDIKGLVGAGYMSENNFHFDDLSPEHKNQVKMTNPEFVDLRSNEWDVDHKTKTAASAPKITKYEDTIRDTFKAHNLKTDLDSGKITMDNIKDEDLRLVANHPHFERKDFDRLTQNVHHFEHENQLLAYGAIKNSRHLTSSNDLHTLLDNNIHSIPFLKDHKLIDSSHIDKVVNINPRLAIRVFSNHRLLNSQHIDKIVENEPWAAAAHLKDNKLLNSQHIDKIVENVPGAAAQYLKDHPLFNSQHIDKIVEKDSWAAAKYLKDHPLLTSQHIDKIIEKEPRAAAYLNDHLLFNSQHIDKIVEKDSWAAAKYLKDHPLLTSQHIDKIIEKEPRAAAEHLKDHPLFNSQHIDKLIEKALRAAAEHLNKHKLLNSQHIDKIVEKDSWAATEYLKDHPLLTSQHIDKIIEKEPSTTAWRLKNHPSLNSQHIDKLVENSPRAVAEHLNKHKLLTSQHIDKIIENTPDAAARYLNKHKLLTSQHIDKIVEKDPRAAAKYFKNHPYYIQKYGQQKIQKSFKQLKNEYERLTKANVDEINRFIEAHGYHFAAVKFKNDPNLNSQHIDQIVEEDPWAAAEYLKDHPSFNSQHIDQIVEENPWAAAEHLNKHKLLTSQHIDKIVENVPGAAAAHYLSDHPLLNSQHIDKIVEKDPEAAAAYLNDHLLFNSQHIDKIVEKAPGAAADYLKDHPLFSSQHIDKIVEKAPGAAADYLKNHPYYIQKYANKNQINFSNNTEILRKLRDTIQEQGGVVNAKDLPKLGFNENSLRINHLKDAKGNYTDTAIQQHIDNQSKHTYNISHTIWKGVQRHSKRGTQSVFQLNYTQEMEKQLKDAGVLDTFEAAHKASFNSNHPVRENTLGWVRYTKGSDGHIHIDEVQSDLGRNLHNVAQGQIEQAEREGQKLSPQEKERLLDLFSKEKIDKMNDIMFKGHHPSKLLHEAFLQHLRNTGHVGKDIHIWQAMPKAKLAGQKTDIHLTNIDLQNFVDFHNKLQNNNIDDFFHDDNDGYEFTNDVVSGLLGDEQASNLYSKHFKNFDITESTSEERQNYINDFVKSKPYQMTLNHLNSHKNPHDSLNAALEHPSIKDKHIKLPFTHNDLPVHMKIGYHETPIRMGYEAGNYGNIETQENDKLKNQPTWKQPLRKSLKALTAEYERLQKAFEANGTWYPEQTDRLGLPHPVQKHLVVHRARNGKHVWSYHPELSRIFDRNLIQLMGGQKISTRNNIQLPNKITSLQKPTVSAIRGFAADLLKNPDRHVMSANTDPTKDRSHSEMRVRHLISALTGSDGYEIKDHSEGFEVYAPRHSKSQKAQEIATRWIYNASKKELRSERIYPTSPDGGNNNGKFGKSIRARSSSNTGRRYVDAGKSASSRPRSSKDIVGKTEAAFKLKLLKAEDEAGMTAYPLKDGYSVHHETSQNGYDIWSIGHNGKRAGSFMICTDDTRRGRPFVSWAGVDNPHRGKGIGAAVYKTLAVHYGGLDSDRNSTSVDAIKAWRRAGGRQIKVKTAFGDYRYTLDGDKKRPPIVWNEDLEKNTNKISPSFAHIKNIDNFDDFTQSAKKLPETAKKEIINYQEEYNKNPPLSSNEELYYHGTPFFNEIKEGGFKNTEGGRAGFLGFVHKVQNLGNYLSNDKKLAHYYGSDRAGHHTNNSKNYEVLSVKVDKGNCLDLTEPKVKIPTAIKKLGLKRLQQYDGLLRSHFIRGKDMVVLLDDPDFVKSLTNHGYDSVKFKEDKGILKNANSSGHTLFVMNPNKLKVHKPIHTLRDMFNHFKELSEEDMSKGQSLEKTNASKTQNMLTFYHGSDTLPIGKKPTKGGFLALDKEFAQNFSNTVHEFVFPSEKILDLRNKNHLEILKTKYPQSDIDFIKGSSQDLPNAFTHEQNATERLEKLKNMALSLGFHGTYQKESDWPNQPVSVEIYNTKHLVPKQNISKSEDLEKGARGDWEKEEGYKVHVNDDIHEPQAVVTHKGKKIGGLNTIKTPHGIKVSMVYVDPEHQRKGLATAMYQAVETKTKTKLIPSDKQTAQGQALWEQPNRQFGKSQTDANKLEKNKMNKSEDSSRVSSVVVVTNDKMLMLQRRDNNKWTFPGGHLNDTETHLEGAVRELWEEAGIKANPDEMILLGNKKTFENKDIYVYLYKINSEVNPSAANDPDKEAQKFAWLPHVLPEDIKENLYIPVGDNSSLSLFSVWLLRQKTNKLKELVKSKK